MVMFGLRPSSQRSPPPPLFSPGRAVELRPDLSCLWKLLGDACTAVCTVSPNRARVLVPGPLAGLEPSTQNHLLDQVQTLKVGER